MYHTSTQILLAAILWVIAASFLANAVCLYRFAWTKPSKLRRLSQGLTLTLCTLFVFFLVMDTVLRFTWVGSESFGFTFGTKRWQTLNTGPTDGGFRHPPEKDLQSTPWLIYCIGDSFTWGQGILQSERYSNRLQSRLRDRALVLNRGMSGWSTSKEIAFLESARPLRRRDGQRVTVVLQYFMNDIEETLGIRVKRPRLKFATLNTFFPVYSWFYTRSSIVFPKEKFRKDMDELYTRPDIVARHQQDLKTFKSMCDSEGSELMMLFIPNLVRDKSYERNEELMVSFFEDNGFEYVDVRSLIDGKRPSEITVNKYDSHANSRLNDAMAVALFKRLT